MLASIWRILNALWLVLGFIGICGMCYLAYLIGPLGLIALALIGVNFVFGAIAGLFGGHYDAFRGDH